jgi:hypothetical protein
MRTIEITVEMPNHCPKNGIFARHHNNRIYRSN